jgi:maltose alpha-D-glucosyltransferase/alpha-amylase
LETNQSNRVSPRAKPVSLIGAWQSFTEEPARAEVAKILSRYAREQRWYRSKSLSIQRAEIEDLFLFGEGNASDHCLVLLGVVLEDGTRESYLMPLRFVAASAGDTQGVSSSIVSELAISVSGRDQVTRGALLDASSSRGFAETLLGLLCGGEPLEGENGRISGESFADTSADPRALEPRSLSLEQSNSTIVYGSTWLLKLLRKIEPDPNVELEVSRFLASASPRPKVPLPVGALRLSTPRGPCTLAVVSEYVENRGSAWALTLESLFTFFERVLSASPASSAVPLPSAPYAECSEEPPEALLSLASPYFTLARLLAERTAELHRALGRKTAERGFGQEPFTVLHQHSMYQSAHSELARSFEKLRERRGSLPAEAAALSEQLLNAQGTLDARLRRITEEKLRVTRTRCHGDYHLGQVLFTGDDFLIIDFEGEPGRPVSERRYKRSPLRDVAGMLRSFAYAAETALRSARVRAEDRTRLAPWAEAFRAWVCVSFVRTYLAGIAAEAYCPESPAQARSLLEFHELEKAVYEVDYELNNRPEWLAVPLTGLLRLAQTRR